VANNSFRQRAYLLFNILSVLLNDRCEWVNVFWYRLTPVVPDRIQTAMKQLCVNNPTACRRLTFSVSAVSMPSFKDT